MKKFKLITLLGIRPDYIRMSKLIRLLDDHGQGLDHFLVHSGQHYDSQLFGNFLKELKIRKPNIDFGIGLELKKEGINNHSYQEAVLAKKVFHLIEKVKPDAVMFLGDTNTVLSSITVSRCGVPVIHLEAGGRSFDWRMPEEKNRIVIDHLSDALYCYLDRYKKILLSEGIEDFRIKVVGNIIMDSLKDNMREADSSNILNKLKINKKEFILVTLHREENIISKDILENKLLSILRFAKLKGLPIIFPVMPRVKKVLEIFSLEKIIKDRKFLITEPLGFFDFLKLEKNARLIVTDSGTVQEEALVLGTPCVVSRYSTERPETIWANATILEGIEVKDNLFNKMKKAFDLKLGWDKKILNPFGGSPSERVYKDLIEKIENNYFKKSRNFEFIKKNKFAVESYGIKR